MLKLSLINSNASVWRLLRVLTWCLAALIKYLPDRYLSLSFVSSLLNGAYLGSVNYTMSPTLNSVVPGAVISIIRLFVAMC